MPIDIGYLFYYNSDHTILTRQRCLATITVYRQFNFCRLRKELVISMKHSLVQNTICILVCLSVGLLMPQKLSLADHGFSDALALSYQQSTKCALPAYDARYYYFLGAAASNSPVSMSNTVISIAPSGKYRVTLYDSRGTSLPLSKSDTNYTCMQSIDAGQRYFLCVRNLSSKNLALSIALHETTTSSNKGSTQATPTPAAKAKQHSPKSPSRTTTPKKFNKPNSSTSKSKKAARSGSSSARSGKSPGSGSSSAKSGKSSGSGSSSERSSKSSRSGSSSTRSSKASGFDFSNPSHTNQSSKNSMPSKSSTPQQSKSAPPPASPTIISHFVRIKKGTSLAIVERIIQDPQTNAYTIKASSPDVSITNGILYVPETGLYYLTVQSKTITTTCTLCVY